jgi:hypothetical protein
MNDSEPRNTFRGLPLTSEQDSEIRHYIHVRARSGIAWDTPELAAMIADMLDPPELTAEDSRSFEDSMAAERSAASVDADAELALDMQEQTRTR